MLKLLKKFKNWYLNIVGLMKGLGTNQAILVLLALSLLVSTKTYIPRSILFFVLFALFQLPYLYNTYNKHI